MVVFTDRARDLRITDIPGEIVSKRVHHAERMAVGSGARLAAFAQPDGIRIGFHGGHGPRCWGAGAAPGRERHGAEPERRKQVSIAPTRWGTTALRTEGHDRRHEHSTVFTNGCSGPGHGAPRPPPAERHAREPRISPDWRVVRRMHRGSQHGRARFVGSSGGIGGLETGGHMQGLAHAPLVRATRSGRPARASGRKLCRSARGGGLDAPAGVARALRGAPR